MSQSRIGRPGNLSNYYGIFPNELILWSRAAFKIKKRCSRGREFRVDISFQEILKKPLLDRLSQKVFAGHSSPMNLCKQIYEIRSLLTNYISPFCNAMSPVED